MATPVVVKRGKKPRAAAAQPAQPAGQVQSLTRGLKLWNLSLIRTAAWR